MPIAPPARVLLHSDPSPSRRTFVAGLAGLCGLALGGCGGGSLDDDDPQASLRFVNGTADFVPADFRVDSEVRAAGLTNGGAATGYGSEDAGTLQVSLHAAGSSASAASSTRAYAEDSTTSVLAYGSLATGLQFAFFDESNAAAAAGMFKVRAFHATSTLGALDVYITNAGSLNGVSPTLSVAAYGALSSFVSVPAGSYRVRITPAGNAGTLLFDFTAGLNVPSTAVLTLVIVPRATGTRPNVGVLPERSNALVMSNELP